MELAEIDDLIFTIVDPQDHRVEDFLVFAENVLPGVRDASTDDIISTVIGFLGSQIGSTDANGIAQVLSTALDKRSEKIADVITQLSEKIPVFAAIYKDLCIAITTGVFKSFLERVPPPQRLVSSISLMALSKRYRAARGVRDENKNGKDG